MLLDGLTLIFFGSYFWLAAYGKIPLNKDPVKNAQTLQKFGPIGRALCPILVVGGVIFVMMSFAQ